MLLSGGRRPHGGSGSLSATFLESYRHRPLKHLSKRPISNYFRNRKVSRTEFLKLLSQFDIRPTAGDKANLMDFVAREIGDVGMYQRVAKGAQRA